MRIKEIKEPLKIPKGVTVKIDGYSVSVKGPKGELTRVFRKVKLAITQEGETVWVKSQNANKPMKMQLFTVAAHIGNMLEGVATGHLYKLKICSGHFPMNAAVAGDTFVIKNFLGEKKPREVKIKAGAKVRVEGQEVIVESPNVEIAGQVAADIEQLSRVGHRDIRIFQDGIYIIEKSGKKLTE
jgi:large subunit ribosomal protein L6